MHKSNVLIFSAVALIAPSLLVSCSKKYGSKLEASRAAAQFILVKGEDYRTCEEELVTRQYVCWEPKYGEPKKYTYFRY